MITELEEHSINAWPSLHALLYDGWILRFADGYTKRANSVNPLYAGSLDVNRKIDACEKLYSERHLDAVFKLTAASFPPGLDASLSARGYQLESRSSVMTLDLQKRATRHDPQDVSLAREVSEAWLSAFCEMSGLDERKKGIARQMLVSVVPEARLASISNSSGKILACGMAVLEEGQLGLFDIVTHKDFRRMGFGKRITDGLLHWGKNNGAWRAYLQVVLNNDPALRLYSSIGFTEAYRYWYRVRKS